MSNQEMSQDEAILFSNVYVPAFVEKCASFGITFNDQESLNEALETAALVKHTLQAQESNVVKTASANLKNALGIKPAVIEKAAAAPIAAHPDVRNAMKAMMEGK